MKYYSFFSLVLLFSLLSAMEQEEQAITAKSSFSSVPGQSIIKINKLDPCILVKEGTLFTEKNQIYVYNTKGDLVKTISPKEKLGMKLKECTENNDQFVIPYGKGIGIFSIEKDVPVIELNTDEIENPTKYGDFKFQDPNIMIVTKEGEIGNYTYILDARKGSNPVTTFHTGYNSINPEGTLSVSYPDGFNKGYARSFNPKDDSIIKSFEVPGSLKMCTPNSLKLIAGQDDSKGMMVKNYVYDVNTGQELQSWNLSENNYVTEQCSDDSKYLAQVTDNTINIIDLTTGQIVKTLKGKEGFMPFSLWISSDNQQLIAVSNTTLAAKDQMKAKKLNKMGMVAHVISQQKLNKTYSVNLPEGKGEVNIWDINLERPKEESIPGKASNSWWPLW